MPKRTETREEIQARLGAGEALSPGQVAALLGVSRYGVDYWLVEGIIDKETGERWFPSFESTPGGHRKVPAADVRRLMDLASRATRRRPPRRRDKVHGSDQGGE